VQRIHAVLFPQGAPALGEGTLHELGHQLTDAARHLTGAKVLAARLYRVGPVTARWR
jgi:hypothetical protein